MNNARKATTNIEKHSKNNARAKKNKKKHRKTEGNANKKNMQKKTEMPT